MKVKLAAQAGNRCGGGTVSAGYFEVIALRMMLRAMASPQSISLQTSAIAPAMPVVGMGAMTGRFALG